MHMVHVAKLDHASISIRVGTFNSQDKLFNYQVHIVNMSMVRDENTVTELVNRDEKGDEGSKEGGEREGDGSGKEELASADSLGATSDGSIRFMIRENFSKDDLVNGKTLRLADITKHLPKGNVIVRNISTNAIGSNVPIDVMCSANLFNSRSPEGGGTNYREAGVSNSLGWLTSVNEQFTVPEGFAPLVNFLPSEYNRTNVTHYSPASAVEDRLVQKYGHLTSMKSLWDNIVPFPGEDYFYVGKDHVVLNIIEKNWEQLGISVPTEKLREEKWVKVASSVVNRVIDELNSSVLSQIPFSNLNDLEFHFQGCPNVAEHVEDGTSFPFTTELNIEYGSFKPE